MKDRIENAAGDGKNKSKKPKKKKGNRWIKFRHRILVAIVRAIFIPLCALKYHISIERFKEQGDRQFLILFNHQTAYDQFFFGKAFRGMIYFVATEDLFSMGFVSRLLAWAMAPIPIKKQVMDLNAMKNIVKVMKEGGSIAIAPEGNRTYDGRTCYIKPTIAPLARKLKLPIALFRLENGYGVQPRWSDVIRKGRMSARVVRVIEPEEVAAMSDDELYKVICDGLDVRENCEHGEFISEKSAEYLERCVYVCPDCGITKFESTGEIIACTTCGRRIRYTKTTKLEGVDREFPFPYVAEWYDYQNKYVNSIDPMSDLTVPVFTDRADVFKVILYKEKNLLYPNAEIALYGDRITITPEGGETIVCPYSEVSDVTVLGKNKLNIYHGKMIYQLKGNERFNALKYVNLHQRSMNILGGHPEETFLGM